MDPEVNPIDTAEAVRLMYIVLGIYGVGLLIIVVGSVFVFLHHSNDRSKSFWAKRREKIKNFAEQRGSGGSQAAEATKERAERDRDKERRFHAIDRQLHPHPLFVWLKKILVWCRISRF